MSGPGRSLPQFLSPQWPWSCTCLHPRIGSLPPSSRSSPGDNPSPKGSSPHPVPLPSSPASPPTQRSLQRWGRPPTLTLARYGVSREVPVSVVTCERVPDTFLATPRNSPTHRVPSRETPRVRTPPHLSPFSPPDRERRVNSPALSARGSRPSPRTSDESKTA